MALAAQLRYDRDFHEAAALAGDLERASLDCLWVAETYGFDAPSFLGLLASRTSRACFRRRDPAFVPAIPYRSSQ